MGLFPRAPRGPYSFGLCRLKFRTSATMRPANRETQERRRCLCTALLACTCTDTIPLVCIFSELHFAHASAFSVCVVACLSVCLPVRLFTRLPMCNPHKDKKGANGALYAR